MAKRIGEGRGSGFTIILEEDWIDDCTRAVMAAGAEVLDEIAEEVRADAVANHWFNNQTGNTEASIYVQVTEPDSQGSVALEAGARTHYSPYLEARESFIEAPLERGLTGFPERARNRVNAKLRNTPGGRRG